MQKKNYHLSRIYPEESEEKISKTFSTVTQPFPITIIMMLYENTYTKNIPRGQALRGQHLHLHTLFELFKFWKYVGKKDPCYKDIFLGSPPNIKIAKIKLLM